MLKADINLIVLYLNGIAYKSDACLGFNDFPKLPIKSFYGICGINKPSDSEWIFKICC